MVLLTKKVIACFTSLAKPETEAYMYNIMSKASHSPHSSRLTMSSTDLPFAFFIGLIAEANRGVVRDREQ